MDKVENARNLEELALKRKEKLNLLKRKREERHPTDEKTSDSNVLPKPKFRSYKPLDEKLTDKVVPEAKVGDVETEVKDQLESAKSGVVIDQLDISTLAPRKVDWDLKRDVAKKLQKLERRTKKAMAEIIRERLKERQENLALIVNANDN